MIGINRYSFFINSPIPIFPVFMIVVGLLWRSFPPKKNVAFGYRSYMSMKNNDTWKFAHLYIGKLWTWVGLVLLVLHKSFRFFFNSGHGKTYEWIIFIEVAVMILTLLPTELALRSKFDNKGKLK